MCFILYPVFSQSTLFVSAQESNSTYYKITENDVFLYKDKNLETPLFELPKTYFVKQLESTSTSVFYVEYNGIFGYIDTSFIEKINGTPQNPYAKATFDMNGSANAVLFSEPNNTSSFLGTIPFNATNIIFYGKTNGQEMLPNMGKTWYYCKYTSFEQGVILGYVYAPLTKNLTPTEPNTESFNEPATNTSALPIEKIIAPEIQNSSNQIMIIAISIFVFFLLFLAFFKGKQKRKRPYNSTRKIDKTQKNLLEFNENDDF